MDIEINEKIIKKLVDNSKLLQLGRPTPSGYINCINIVCEDQNVFALGGTADNPEINFKILIGKSDASFEGFAILESCLKFLRTGELEIVGDKITCNGVFLQTLPAQQVTSWDYSFDETNCFIDSLQNFSDSLISASKDETRYNINSVFLDCSGQFMRIVATDGHRLSIIDQPDKTNCNRSAMIQRTGLEFVLSVFGKKESCEVCWNKPFTKFVCGASEIIIKNNDNEYPDYKQVIPDIEAVAKIKVDKTFRKVLEEFKNIFGAKIKMKNEKGKEIKHPLITHIIANGLLSLSAGNDAVVTEQSCCDYTGKGSVNISNAYLLDAFKFCGDEFTLKIYGDLLPVAARCGDRHAYVMPMRDC